jgi:hypothetical protein
MFFGKPVFIQKHAAMSHRHRKLRPLTVPEPVIKMR